MTNPEKSYFQWSRGEHPSGARLKFEGKGLSAEFHQAVITAARNDLGGNSILRTLKESSGLSMEMKGRLPKNGSKITNFLKSRRRYNDDGTLLPKITNVLDVLRWAKDRQVTTAEELEEINDEYRIITLQVRILMHSMNV